MFSFTITKTCFLATLLLSVPSFCYATSPGGVNSDLYAWFKADGSAYHDDTTQATNNQSVKTWVDMAGSRNAGQDTYYQRPLFKTNILNGFPTLLFDGGNDFFSFDGSGIKNSSYSLFLVGVRGDGGANFGIGSVGGATNQSLHFGYRDGNTRAILGQWGNDVNITVRGYDDPEQTPYLLFGEFDSSTGHEMTEYRDGSKSHASNTNTTGLSGTQQTYLARMADWYYKGDIAEAILYSDDLAETEEKKILSYLALKYGISLRGHLDYVSSDGTTIFAGMTGYSDHHHDIAGIGKDIGSSLTVSSGASQGDDAILRISHPSSLDNNDFLLWGNDNGSFTTSKDDTPWKIISRLQRVWRFHETGDVGTVTVSVLFDNFDILNTNDMTNYALLISNDGDFHDARRIDATSLTDNVLSFAGVTIPSGSYVTIGLADDNLASLGGVLHGVRLWLDADDPSTLHTDASCTSAAPSNNTDVACWQDKSGNDAHVTAVSGDCVEIDSGVQTCGVPTYKTNQFNGKPALEFFQSNKETLRHDLAASGKQWTGNNFTLFIIFGQIGSTGEFHSFFSNGTPAGDDHFQIDISGGNQFRVLGFGPRDIFFDAADNSLKLYSVRATPSRAEIFEDGDLISEHHLPSVLGRIFEHYRINQNRHGRRLNDSRMGELIIYDRALSNCDFDRIDQYLGHKFGKFFEGGVPGNAECEEVYFWFDPNAGIATTSGGVSEWVGSGHHKVEATQGTGSQRPTLSTNDVHANGDVFLIFDGNDRLSFPAVRAPTSAEQRSFYMAVRPSTATNNSGIVLSNGANAVGRKMSLGVTPTQVSVDSGGHVYGVTRPSTTETELVVFEFDDSSSTSDGWEIRVNGVDQTESTLSGSPQTVNTGSTAAAIGADVFSSSGYKGKIGDLFGYAQVLAPIDRGKVETYLALTYGITLGSANDYIDTLDNVLFDPDGADNGYGHDIAGVGQEDSQKLDLNTSKSQNTDALISVTAQDTLLEDGEFLLWGNNDGALTETSINVPSSVGRRLTRIWKFREREEVGPVTLSFDLSGLTVSGSEESDFTLITDSDSTFSSGAVLVNAHSFTNNVVTFRNVDIDDATYVSLSTNAGTLSVSVVDTADRVVASPVVSFANVTRDDIVQTAAGTLGTASEKITILNTSGATGWSLNLAAQNTALVWRDSGGGVFDFNDSIADGSDPDPYGGTLTVNPSAATITAVGSGCDTNGLTKGSRVAFSEGVVDTVTLVTAGSRADRNCSWHITGIALSQEIPGSQTVGSYTLPMVLSVVAQ